nr:hypothetical protein [Tanacetum cinerariifolium]
MAGALHQYLADMVVKMGYGVADLMYYHFLISRLGLDYGPLPFNADADVLAIAKYVKDYKIVLVYVEHGSSTHHSSVEGPIVVESAYDPFDDLDEILYDYENTVKQINRDEITRKKMVFCVGNSSTIDDMLDLQMLFDTEGVGPIGKLREVEVDVDNESEEESDTEGNYTSSSDLEDSDYDPKHDEVFNDDDYIVEHFYVSMNNFNLTANPKHNLSICGVEVQEDDQMSLIMTYLAVN